MFENNNLENMLENLPIEDIESLMFSTHIMEEWELLEIIETGAIANA